MFDRVRRAIAKLLMPPFKFIASLFQKATAQGSRSTVLKPLGWLIGLCGGALLGVLKYHSPVWLLVILSIFFGLSASIYLAAFIHCLFTNPDLLRSETYLITQLAIQKGLIGDSSVGAFDPDTEPEAEAAIVAVKSSSSQSAGGEQK
jgi:hypothetical protein